MNVPSLGQDKKKKMELITGLLKKTFLEYKDRAGTIITIACIAIPFTLIFNGYGVFALKNNFNGAMPFGTLLFVAIILAYALDGTRGMRALKRSKELVAGNWWAVFGRLIIFGIISFFIGLTIGQIPLIGSLINMLFIMPLGIIYGYFIYEDLKAMKM